MFTFGSDVQVQVRVRPSSRACGALRARGEDARLAESSDASRSTRFTFDPASGWFAEWSPDGRQIIFDSNRRSTTRDLYIKPTDRATSEQLLLEAEGGSGLVGIDWSPDRRFLLYLTIKPADYDIWVLPLTGTRKPFPFLRTQFVEKGAQFSPDGRWVAYMSDESRRMEIYLRPFIEPDALATSESLGAQWQVSIAGGIYPTWRADGRELYYIGTDRTMMGVPVSIAGSKVEVGTPVPLFETQIVGGDIDNQQNRQYDVTPDGRFLLNTLLDDATPITLLQNWKGP